MRDVVHNLVVPEWTAEKLGRRGISPNEVAQLTKNRHLVLANRRSDRADRRIMLGETNGGRPLTVVIEERSERTDWLVVTGWDSDPKERRMRRK